MFYLFILYLLFYSQNAIIHIQINIEHNLKEKTTTKRIVIWISTIVYILFCYLLLLKSCCSCMDRVSTSLSLSVSRGALCSSSSLFLRKLKKNSGAFSSWIPRHSLFNNRKNMRINCWLKWMSIPFVSCCSSRRAVGRQYLQTFGHGVYFK